MSLVTRYANLVTVLVAAAAAAALWIEARHDFDDARRELISGSRSSLLAHPELRTLLYWRDADRVGTFLAHLTGKEAIVYAGAYDVDSDLITLHGGQAGLDPLAPDLGRLRAAIPPLEAGFDTRTAGAAGLTGQLAGFKFPFRERRVEDVSFPVVSSVYPLDAEISVDSLLAPLAQDAEQGSRYVIGFVAIGINRSLLWQRVLNGLAPRMLLYLCGVLATLFITRLYGRRLFGSLVQLAEAAREAATGPVDLNTTFEADGEGQPIADLLNVTFKELKRRQTDVTTDRELLNLKVTSQDSQLAELDQKLDAAKTEVARTQEDLHRMAYFDSLTGLPNRRLFTEQLQLVLRLCERENDQLALMFVDLDNFKRINDSLGHSAGDLLLREVSIRLANCTRTSDLLGHFSNAHVGIEVSRLGGDEFTIVATNLKDEKEAAIVAQRALKALNEPILIDAHELVITPSVGIAIGPRDGKDVESLLRAADTAMYEAKAKGKNKYVFYNDAMKTSDVLRLRLEADLRSATEKGELKLYYQPMVSLETGTVVGVEALVRWQHPEKGVLAPADFMPLAEELGMSVEIGEWTFREACRMVNELDRELDMNACALSKICVNISPLAVSRTFVNRVREVIAETTVDPSYLELEITENVLMGTDAASIDFLEQLKRLGLGLSIDDFGTGYSSLTYLSHFPLDTLKIDRSFVQDYGKSRSNESLVEAIAAMALKLDLNVVAEGVETADQLHFLRGLGVDVIQGYLLSRPVTAQQLPFLLKDGHFKSKIAKALLTSSVEMTIDPA